MHWGWCMMAARLVRHHPTSVCAGPWVLTICLCSPMLDTVTASLWWPLRHWLKQVGPTLRTVCPFLWLSHQRSIFLQRAPFPWPGQQRAVPYETGSRWFWVSFSNSFGQAGADQLILGLSRSQTEEKAHLIHPGPGLLGRVPRIYWHSNLVGRINTFHCVFLMSYCYCT